MTDQDELWCPRRAETGIQFPGPDTWRPTSGIAGASAEATPTCSYCGSLEPGRFLQLVEAGWIVEPTDHSYKVYLARPLSEQEIDQRHERWLANDALARAVRSVEQAAGKTEEQVKAELDKRWAHELDMWAGSAREAKFYFRHLSAQQKQAFVDLYNAKEIHFGFPGYFYQQPYFFSYGDTDG